MTKVEKSGGGTGNMWSLNQKISTLFFVKLNIPALKYGRDMEIEAANSFVEFIKGKLTEIKLSDCGLFIDETLPYLGASPDQVLLFSCCVKACVEIKCPYSIKYKNPCCPNLEYLRLCDGKTVLKKSHKYYTQCMLQMAVTGTINTARKTIFSFSECFEKMVFPKKSHWNMIFLVLSGKMIFLFPENMILFFRHKRKDDLSQKNTWKYDIFFKCSEKMVFPKNSRLNMIFFVISGKMVFLFSRKYDIFSLGGK